MKKLSSFLLVLFAVMLIAGSANAQYLSEGFESAFVGDPPAPSGWTQTKNRPIQSLTTERNWLQNTYSGGAWLYTGGTAPTTGPYAGSGVLWIDDYNYMGGSTPQNSRRMESPSMNLSSSTSPYLRFWYFNNEAVGLAMNLRVMVSGDGGATWALLTPIVNGFTVTNLSWNRISVAIPAAYRTGNAKIAFEITNKWGTNNPFIDDVSVEEYTPVTITSAGTGDWNTPATWVGGAVPTADNNVVIDAGHTVTVTNTTSTTGILGRCQNLTINATGILQYGAGTANLLHVYGNIVVNGTLNAFNGTSGRMIYCGGNFTINPGGVATLNTSTTAQAAAATTTISTVASGLVWLGNQAAAFTNNGTLTAGRINNILHLNPGGVTYNSPVGVPFTVGLHLGDVNPNGNLTLGNAAASGVTQIIHRANGTFTTNPIWNNTNMTARSNYYYSPNWVPLTQTTLTTGSEIEDIAGVRTTSGAFTMNTHNNLQLTYPLTIGTATTGSWTMTRGIIISDATNLLWTSTFVTSNPAGTAPNTATPPTTHGSYVAGPLRRTFDGSGTTSRTFPLGVGTAFNGAAPSANVLKSLTLAPGTAASQSPTISIVGAPTGSAGSPLTSVIGTRAFRINLNGGADFPATATFTMTAMNYTFGNSDNLIGLQEELRIAQSTSLSGPWSERSATLGTGAFVNNTVYSRTSATAAPGPIGPIATNGEYFCWATTAPVMSYTSSTATQTLTTNVGKNTVNNRIIGIEVVVTGALSPLSSTGFIFSTNGSTNPATDISNASLYYTGTSSTFATTTLFGTFASPSGEFEITGTQVLSAGTNYFWLTYDVPSGAVTNNLIDAECSKVKLGLNEYTPTVTDPGTGRTIKAPMSGTYSVGTTLLNRIFGKSFEYRKFTRTVQRTVPLEKEVIKGRDNEIDNIKVSNLFDNSATSSNNEKTRLVEAQEDYYVLYENGMPYTGPSYFSFSENDGPNANGDYTTLEAAITDLNNLGISGPVIFELYDNNFYPASGVVINSVVGSSSSNTVKIKPASGRTVTITGNTASYTIALNGSDYVTIDGSNNGTNTKDLTVVNTYLAGSFNFGIGLYHNGVKGATNSTIKNCIIVGDPTETNSYGLFLNGAGGGFNNTSIINNTVKNAKIGIQFAGISGNITNDGLISGNIFGDAVQPLKQGGILCAYTNNLIISENNIFGEALGNTNTSQYGISIINITTNTKIRRNSIHDFYYTGTNGWACFGINYNSDASTVTEISNNTIYNIKADGDKNAYANALYVVSGIYAKTGGNLQIYNNSVYLSGNTLGSGTYDGISACLSIDPGITLLDVRNNAFQNSMGSFPGSLMTNNTYSVVSFSANTAFTDFNFNDYFVNGINPNVGYLITDKNDLTAWQTATGKDYNSVNGNPGFTSETNLQPDVNNTNCWNLNSGAYPLASVSTDFLGNPRSTTLAGGASDIGAYEFTPTSTVAPVNISGTPSTVTPTTITTGGITLATITWYSTLEALPDNITVNYKPGVNPSNTPLGSKFANEIIEVTATGGSGYTYDITLKYNLSRQGTITSEANFRLAKYDGATWVQYPALPDQVNKTITVTGLNSFSTFSFGDNDSPLPVQLASFTSSINGRDVKLTWKTESEINNSGFDVERSISGLNQWVKAGFVAGKGNSNSPVNYTFEDKKLNSGKYNYRLKQIDNNGNFEYFALSNVVEVGLPTKYDLSQNYPNPFNPVTKIDFSLPLDSRVSIKLYDISGREVKTLVNDSRTAGYYTVQFNASDLSSGTYFYRIMTKSSGADYIMTKKMMLIK